MSPGAAVVVTRTAAPVAVTGLATGGGVASGACRGSALRRGLDRRGTQGEDGQGGDDGQGVTMQEASHLPLIGRRAA